MTRTALSLGASVALAAVAAANVQAAGSSAKVIPASIQSVEFVGMTAPETPAQRAQAYTEAKVKISYRNGSTREFPLTYNVLHDNTTTIEGVTAGMVYDINGIPLLDPNGKPYISESPDANSLLEIPGTVSCGPENNTLHLITHYEYDWLDSAGTDMYGKLPMTMNLATISQDKKTGVLTTMALKNIDMSGVGGLWIPCAGSLSPWNTHLGSEEYEPDARCEVELTCASGALGLDAMNRYFGTTTTAKPYNYGLVPEVTVDRSGSAKTVKHRVLGRISRELVQVMPDSRTVYQGDDGTYNVLTMFVADTPGDLSSGTLYAAKWHQTSAANGGAADLRWIRLGHGTDREIEVLANTLSFSDIFEVAAVPTDGFKTIKAGHNKGLVEHLRLRTGMAKAAAFLETRRYSAYLGATTEFEKFEGVTVNAADKKLYVAMTRLRDGMEDKLTDPMNDIRLPRLLAGAVYQIDLAGGKRDTSGNPIASDYVGTHMSGLVLGQDIPKDAAGNTAAVDRIANPDNLKYSEKMRVLFIGEDSSTAHINNFLWAYHLDTGTLARILSLPAGAESTGLQAIDDLNGFTYIMSNYQHAGDFSTNIAPALKAQLEPLIDRSKAAIGYLGGVPGFN